MPSLHLAVGPQLFGFTPESLVQLANIGCSGVAIVGVMVSAYLVTTTPVDQRTLGARGQLTTRFMSTCVWLALISAASAGWLGYQNASKVQMAEEKVAEQVQLSTKLQSESQQVIALAQQVRPPSAAIGTLHNPTFEKAIRDLEVTKKRLGEAARTAIAK